jgi:hypothetical protein
MEGQRFGRLTVIKQSDRKDTTRSIYWECQCDCGETKTVRGTSLRSGRVNSCGCLLGENYKSGTTKIDIVGRRFGMLTVISESTERSSCGEVKYVCQCDCGNTKTIVGTSLRNGKTKSCGCFLAKSSGDRSYKHGLTTHPLYKIWSGIVQRCHCETDTAYKYYGARGITVCDEWRYDPEAFINWSIDNGWEIGLEIDRIDNYEGYNPSNCRYVTHKVNMQNRRQK